MSIPSGKEDRQPLQVVNLTASVYQTRLGNYFMGQTGSLTFGNGSHAWGGLCNPSDSGVHLFWNVFTVSNYSPEPYTIEFWLNNSSLGRGNLSRNVVSANQAIRPLPSPKVELRDADRIHDYPKDGLFSFLRIAEPKATLTRHDFQGMIILPPGGSVIAFLRSPGKGTVRSRVAFGWWEDASAGKK